VGSRRTLGSSVGAVLQHDNDDEEEYDPRRPAIGNVASVIKVTERRCTQNCTVSHIVAMTAIGSFSVLNTDNMKTICDGHSEISRVG